MVQKEWKKRERKQKIENAMRMDRSKRMQCWTMMKRLMVGRDAWVLKKNEQNKKIMSLRDIELKLKRLEYSKVDDFQNDMRNVFSYPLGYPPKSEIHKVAREISQAFELKWKKAIWIDVNSASKYCERNEKIRYDDCDKTTDKEMVQKEWKKRERKQKIENAMRMDRSKRMQCWTMIKRLMVGRDAWVLKKNEQNKKIMSLRDIELKLKRLEYSKVDDFQNDMRNVFSYPLGYPPKSEIHKVAREISQAFELNWKKAIWIDVNSASKSCERNEKIRYDDCDKGTDKEMVQKEWKKRERKQKIENAMRMDRSKRMQCWTMMKRLMVGRDAWVLKKNEQNKKIMSLRDIELKLKRLEYSKVDDFQNDMRNVFSYPLGYPPKSEIHKVAREISQAFELNWKKAIWIDVNSASKYCERNEKIRYDDCDKTTDKEMVQKEWKKRERKQKIENAMRMDRSKRMQCWTMMKRLMVGRDAWVLKKNEQNKKIMSLRDIELKLKRLEYSKVDDFQNDMRNVFSYPLGYPPKSEIHKVAREISQAFELKWKKAIWIDVNSASKSCERNEKIRYDDCDKGTDKEMVQKEWKKRERKQKIENAMRMDRSKRMQCWTMMKRLMVGRDAWVLKKNEQNKKIMSLRDIELKLKRLEYSKVDDFQNDMRNVFSYPLGYPPKSEIHKVAREISQAFELNWKKAIWIDVNSASKSCERNEKIRYDDCDKGTDKEMVQKEWKKRERKQKIENAMRMDRSKRMQCWTMMKRLMVGRDAWVLKKNEQNKKIMSLRDIELKLKRLEYSKVDDFQNDMRNVFSYPLGYPPKSEIHKVAREISQAFELKWKKAIWIDVNSASKSCERNEKIRYDDCDKGTDKEMVQKEWKKRERKQKIENAMRMDRSKRMQCWTMMKRLMVGRDAWVLKKNEQNKKIMSLRDIELKLKRLEYSKVDDFQNDMRNVFSYPLGYPPKSEIHKVAREISQAFELNWKKAIWIDVNSASKYCERNEKIRYDDCDKTTDKEMVQKEWKKRERKQKIENAMRMDRSKRMQCWTMMKRLMVGRDAWVLKKNEQNKKIMSLRDIELKLKRLEYSKVDDFQNDMRNVFSYPLGYPPKSEIHKVAREISQAFELKWKKAIWIDVNSASKSCERNEKIRYDDCDKGTDKEMVQKEWKKRERKQKIENAMRMDRSKRMQCWTMMKRLMVGRDAWVLKKNEQNKKIMSLRDIELKLKRLEYSKVDDFQNDMRNVFSYPLGYPPKSEIHKVAREISQAFELNWKKAIWIDVNSASKYCERNEKIRYDDCDKTTDKEMVQKEWKKRERKQKIENAMRMDRSKRMQCWTMMKRLMVGRDAWVLKKNEQNKKIMSLRDIELKLKRLEYSKVDDFQNDMRNVFSYPLGYPPKSEIHKVAREISQAFELKWKKAIWIDVNSASKSCERNEKIRYDDCDKGTDKEMVQKEWKKRERKQKIENAMRMDRSKRMQCWTMMKRLMVGRDAWVLKKNEQNKKIMSLRDIELKLKRLEYSKVDDFQNDMRNVFSYPLGYPPKSEIHKVAREISQAFELKWKKAIWIDVNSASKSCERNEKIRYDDCDKGTDKEMVQKEWKKRERKQKIENAMRMDRSKRMQCWTMMKRLMVGRDAWVLKKNEQNKKIMSLRDIELKLKRLEYSKVDDFQNDMRNVFSYPLGYPPKSEIHKVAREISQAFELKWKKAIWIDVNSASKSCERNEKIRYDDCDKGTDKEMVQKEWKKRERKQKIENAMRMDRSKRMQCWTMMKRLMVGRDA
ncbi:hypothetical protein V8G54_020987 [Vigna mungo]|uniref:Bromo domain-containing protein n=1 Tax=Vigna mungo TaxID=3915 RepID=A0AAQ3NEQ9_VIGMU